MNENDETLKYLSMKIIDDIHLGIIEYIYNFNLRFKYGYSDNHIFEIPKNFKDENLPFDEIELEIKNLIAKIEEENIIYQLLKNLRSDIEGDLKSYKPYRFKNLQNLPVEFYSKFDHRLEYFFLLGIPYGYRKFKFASREFYEYQTILLRIIEELVNLNGRRIGYLWTIESMKFAYLNQRNPKLEWSDLINTIEKLKELLCKYLGIGCPKDN